MAVGQDGQTTVPSVTDRVAEISATDNRETMPVQLALGTAKPSQPCPVLCILQRDTDPRSATVGEREVVNTMERAVVPADRLHVDRRRSAALLTGKLPRGAMMAPGPGVAVTRGAFRPVLDPVLAAPVTETKQ